MRVQASLLLCGAESDSQGTTMTPRDATHRPMEARSHVQTGGEVLCPLLGDQGREGLSLEAQGSPALCGALTHQ